MLDGNKEMTKKKKKKKPLPILSQSIDQCPQPRHAKPSRSKIDLSSEPSRQGNWKRNRVYEVPEPSGIQAWPKYMKTIVNNLKRNETRTGGFLALHLDNGDEHNL